jgi:hypothetical protein
MNNKFETYELYAKQRYIDRYGIRRMVIELTYKDVVDSTVSVCYFNNTWRCSDNTQIANQALEYLWEHGRMFTMLKQTGENYGW